MKLTQEMVDYLHGPRPMSLGTRDAALLPFANRVYGAIVEPDRESVTIYVLESQFSRILSNLENNGKIAFAAVNILNHESYQFKGNYLHSRKSNEQDEAIQNIYQNKFIPLMEMLGISNQVLGKLAFKPCMAITFSIDEVFDQTPGPGAGKKLTEGVSL